MGLFIKIKGSPDEIVKACLKDISNSWPNTIPKLKAAVENLYLFIMIPKNPNINATIISNISWFILNTPVTIIINMVDSKKGGLVFFVIKNKTKFTEYNE